MFKKYNSIENTYRQGFLDRIESHGFSNLEYIVQEKAHGANLSYWTKDGLNFHSAKRTESIKQEEKFYNYELVLEKIKPSLINIWKELKEKTEGLKQVTFYGELIGGSYPHKMVERDNSSKKVQKGIYYSPDNQFYAFDIMINAAEYLDVTKANYYFEKEHLLHAKTLFKGDLDSCLNYSNEFESTISKDLDLPKLDHNICEGVIIRPIKNVYFNNGVRVILKNKNENWSENKKHHISIKITEEIPEKIIKLQEVILNYATENRLNNVVSKLGEVTEKDIGKALGMFNKDIVDDFKKDYIEVVSELEKKELKLITKSIGKVTIRMVKRICT